MRIPNTITGDLKLLSALTAKYDDEMSGVTGDTTLKFQKDLLYGTTAKNLRLYSGIFAPANNMLLVASFAQSDPRADMIIIEAEHPVGVLVTMNSPTLGAAYPVNSNLVEHMSCIRIKKRKDFFVSRIELDARTVLFDSPADIDQTKPIKYMISVFEN